MSELVQIDGAPRPKADPKVVAGIAMNLVLVCAVSAIVLGGVYVGTERYQREARLAGERAAVSGMLALGADAQVTEVRQYLDPAKREVRYLAKQYGDESAPTRTLVFGLDGSLREAEAAPAGAAEPTGLEELGRLFVAKQGGALAGFVLEGESRGYKNRIRFFVALDSSLAVLGVRVLEHEEDPGLGAEIATPVFRAQFTGRTPDEIAALGVTRDPMPEDWHAALAAYASSTGGEAPADWRSLLERERTKPIYAVTGATISSRALTRGVKGTVDHFRRRWALLAPRLEGEGASR
ncbi:MAG: FMN-binding protein [Candidatus Eisenbacteria bacterium]|uniref:Ion-translocating oxidoreductase complex subunit G n=1 Tax=Eiseniibacteriota bacterium TaxID=2212470 RepID=A0A933SDR9_UNCEI|nr:FMN-binding protein [Candidatus Eisenbacteria bacterium]